jgi:hypothetical protein
VKKKGLIGVKNDHGVIIWEKPIPINSFFSTWSRDGRFIALSVDKPYHFTNSKKENFPTLNAELNGIVKQDGTIEVKNFKLL